MKRSASEVLSDLEIRVARLENLTASETEAGYKEVRQWFREKLYYEKELLIDELFQNHHPHVSVGNFHFMRLKDAKKYLPVIKHNEKVFGFYNAYYYVLIYHDMTPLLGSSYVVNSDMLASRGSLSSEVAEALEDVEVRIACSDERTQEKIKKLGRGHLIATGYGW